jgi:hypothetical protein
MAVGNLDVDNCEFSSAGIVGAVQMCGGVADS